MSNINITNVNIGPNLIDGKTFETDVLTVAGAVTVLEGTIVARDSVSLKYVPFVKGGATNENGIPKGILTYALTSEGAGDEPVRVLTSGIYRTDGLIIDADGTDANVDAAVLDQLRDFNIATQTVQDLSELDNQ